MPAVASAIIMQRLADLYGTTRLEQTVVIHNGQGLAKADRDSSGPYPVYAAGGLVGNHTERLTSEPFVVIGRKGSAGKPTYASQGGWVIDTAYYAQPCNSNLSCKFLYYALETCDFSNDIISTAIPGINRTAIYRHEIPVPPRDVQIACADFIDALAQGKALPKLPQQLSEQRRIVARIEDLAAKIEEARGLRIRSQAEVDEVYDAECRTLFESNDWEFKSVEKAVGRENLRNGKSVKSSEHPDGVRCLRLSAMQSGRLVCEEAKPVPLSLEEAHDYLIHERDVFVIRGNGSKELVGRAAMAEQSDNRTIFPDLFIRVPLADSGWTPEFFVAYWNSPIMRAVLTEAAKTTSGIWKVNQGHIGSCKIPVLPHEEQVRIVAHLDGVKAKLDSLKNLLAETSAELEAMLPSILDKAFKGNI